MSENKRFLDNVYGLDEARDTKQLYRDWAESYDDELRENGYVSPQRCAAALKDAAGSTEGPLLDVGCGTGLSGEAFAAAGFAPIDGTDFSEEMLEIARAKGVYRNLLNSDASDPLPFEPGAYRHMAAVGLFSPGHAPASLIHDAVAKLPSGGCLVFTLNEHALEDASYEGAIREVVDAGGAELLFKEHGDHVPGIGLKATVCVLRKR